MTDIIIGSANLGAARRLVEKISFDKIIQGISGQEETDSIWYEDVDFWARLLERSEITNMNPERVMAEARNFRALENLVKALDALETVASLMVLSTEYVFGILIFENTLTNLGPDSLMETETSGVQLARRSRMSRSI
jgi:hypothetical protein